MDSYLTCERCEYSSSNKSNMSRHIKMVHDKIEDIRCGLCDYLKTLFYGAIEKKKAFFFSAVNQRKRERLFLLSHTHTWYKSFKWQMFAGVETKSRGKVPFNKPN